MNKTELIEAVAKEANLSKKDAPHVPECPKEKEDAIMDAFRHFGLIE